MSTDGKQPGNALLASADEIDAIATKRENAQREMERRIVAQMLTCMDDLSGPPPSAHPQTPGPPGADTPTPEPAAPASRHVVIIGKALCMTCLHSPALLNAVTHTFTSHPAQVGV